MRICIATDSERLASTISDGLEEQLSVSSELEIVDQEALGYSCKPLQNFSGVVFYGTEKLDLAHLEQVRQLRSAVAENTNIVVVASGTDNSAVIKAIRAGASDFLCADESFIDELRSFLTRTSAENSECDSVGRVFTIIPCQAASDANLLASNLAAVWAGHLGSCGLLDFHFRGGDLAMYLKQDPRHTLLDLLRQSDTIDEAMLQQAVVRHESGIELLAGPPPFSDIWDVRYQGCQDIISLAKKRWPIIVVSCEDAQHTVQINSLATSGDIILTMRLDLAALYCTQKHVEFLVQKGVSSDRIHVVAMGTGHSGELPLKGVKKVLNVSHVHTIPDYPTATIMSLNIGNPMVIELPQAKPSVAIRSFANALIGAVEQRHESTRRNTVSAMKAATVLALNTLPAFR